MGRSAVVGVLAVSTLAALLLPAGEPKLVSPGVRLEQIRDPQGPWEVRVLRIRRAARRLHLVAALGEGQVRGLERLSAIIDREAQAGGRTLAAVNGDFFQMRGDHAGSLTGPCVRNGELISIGGRRPAFAVLDDGTPYIGPWATTGQVRWESRSWQVDRVNAPQQGGEGCVQLFTAVGGWEVAEGCVVASLSDAPLRVSGRWQGTVTEVVPPGTPRSASAGELMVSARDERVRAALLQARPGDLLRVQIETRGLPQPVAQAVGGGPVLVSGGKVVAGDQVRHPRTAVGFNEREIVLVTVDGRQPDWSVGMTLTELAQLMVQLGCQEAINLDGGGSTTMWVRGRVLNRPSDGRERSIANALLVVREG